MPLSMAELAQTRETIADLLEELKLDAYLFEVEPHNGQWELKVDCAIDSSGAWETVILSIPKTLLLACREDTEARQQLLGDLRDRLTDCKRRKP